MLQDTFPEQPDPRQPGESSGLLMMEISSRDQGFIEVHFIDTSRLGIN
jgi:hypothetical protein